MGLADLHIHTHYSWDGTCTVRAVLKHVADRTNLSVIAITDHDEIRGAREALDLAPSYGVKVIPGCEISTREGHLLALFIEHKVPAGLPLVETIWRVGDLGGLCVAAHPMARGSSSLSAKAIRDALDQPWVDDVLVGIEAFNAGLFHRSSNCDAQNLARTLPLAHLGNSDSHLVHTIGQASTLFPGSTPADLRLALETRQTGVRLGRLSNGWSIVGNWLPRYALRSAGWVTSNDHPRSPLRLARVAQLG